MRRLGKVMVVMTCILTLLGCSRTTTTLNVLNEFEVEYLKQCLLHDYTQTELANCYIELSEEVSFGNKQLKHIETSSNKLQELYGK